MRRLPKTHKKLPMKKGDEPDFYSLDKANPLPALEDAPIPGLPHSMAMRQQQQQLQQQQQQQQVQQQSNFLQQKTPVQMTQKTMHQSMMESQPQYNIASSHGLEGMSPLRMMPGGPSMFSNMYAQSQQQSQQISQSQQQQLQLQQSQLEMAITDDFDVVPLCTDPLSPAPMFGGNMQLSVNNNNFMGGGLSRFNGNSGLSHPTMRNTPSMRQSQSFRPSPQMMMSSADNMNNDFSPTPDEIFFHQQQMKMKQMQQLMPSMPNQQQMFDRNGLMDDYGMLHMAQTHPRVQRPQC
jgi:hypothetical protein